MKNKLPPGVEKGRLTTGPMRSDSSYGMNGFFMLSRKGSVLAVMAGDGCPDDWKMAGFDLPAWEHCSVSLKHRCPSWNEMAYVKALWWDDDETVIQIHPPAAYYVNEHQYCLHLWRPVGIEIPLPPKGTLA